MVIAPSCSVGGPRRRRVQAISRAPRTMRRSMPIGEIYRRTRSARDGLGTNLGAAQLLRERFESPGILPRYPQVETEQREQASRSVRDPFTRFEKCADTLDVLR